MPALYCVYKTKIGISKFPNQLCSVCILCVQLCNVHVPWSVEQQKRRRGVWVCVWGTIGPSEPQPPPPTTTSSTIYSTLLRTCIYAIADAFRWQMQCICPMLQTLNMTDSTVQNCSTTDVLSNRCKQQITIMIRSNGKPFWIHITFCSVCWCQNRSGEQCHTRDKSNHHPPTACVRNYKRRTSACEFIFIPFVDL